MTGVIWFVQLVHYPLFVFGNKRDFTEFSKTHSQNAGYVVILPMIAELVTSILLLISNSSTGNYYYYTAAFILLVIIWISTFLIQVPSHIRLSTGYNKAEINVLVKFNWIRTTCWTLRSILLLYLMVRING